MAEIPETIRSRTVLQYGLTSVKSFFAAFDQFLKAHKAKTGGAPTDVEHDLLRAALVFAAATLDSCLKELVKGSLRRLADIDESVAEEFQSFVYRQIKGDVDEGEKMGGAKFLAGVLVSGKPQEVLLEAYVLSLTGTSLQSVNQLLKTASALGVNTKNIVEKRKLLDDIFQRRNKIIHELDVTFTGKQGHRNRNRRSRTEMEKSTDELLGIAKVILDSVEAKLSIGTA